MARKNQLVEMNTFVAGLVTEASPLTFPPNASLDEANFELLKNGSRKRRLGMDFEDGYETVVTNVYSSTTAEYPVNTYKWKDVNSNPSLEILVVQLRNYIYLFNLSSSSISPNLITSLDVGDTTDTHHYSFASVDGKLVVATGDRTLRVYAYDEGTGGVSGSEYALYIRDLFGVYEDLAVGANVTTRPSTLSDEHLYNLRNQTWASPRHRSDINSISDPITYFYERSNWTGTLGDPLSSVKNSLTAGNVFPSNSDNVTYALYPNVDIVDDRVSRRFFARDLLGNNAGSGQAPRGHFILNAFDRGNSRNSRYSQLMSNNPDLVEDLDDRLPTDQSYHVQGSVGGPKVVCEFSGRLFYAGNPPHVAGGDRFSPDMSKYVLFSRIIHNQSDFGICYQEGDPTSEDNFDLLDTDGGFIRISECYNICHMVEMGNKLIVFAQNGVWYITGGNDYGFKATDYKVVKVTDRGTRSPKSIVVVNDSVYYWSDDGIYVIGANQMGDISAQNITSATINTLYISISEVNRAYADGVYDSYEKKIRWIYGNRFQRIGAVIELVYDVETKAFYKNRVDRVNLTSPLLMSAFVTSPFTLDSYDEVVTYNGEDVTYLGEDVTYTYSIEVPVIREVKYLVFTDISGRMEFTFSSYKDPLFRDWYSYDGVGIDAEAFMYTGYMAGETFLLNKQVPYISFFFERTEDGFDTVDGEIVPRNQSSCKVRALWDWSDSINSGRWTPEFQAYRYQRPWIPATGGSAYDYGQSVITTKSKLRGKGRVMSLYIKTEPQKDCRLLGWSMMVSQDGNA